jgi:hypothetical protein
LKESTTIENISRHGIANEMSQLELHSITGFTLRESVAFNNMIQAHVVNDLSLTPFIQIAVFILDQNLFIVM